MTPCIRPRAREAGRPLEKAFNIIIWYSMIAVLLAVTFFYG